MDLLGIAALGGLERITIVLGAIVIGYWGFKLYTGGKTAGMVFMGLSFVVLVGALATGGSHLRQVGEGVQLATLEQPAAPAPGAQDTQADPAAAVAAESAEAASMATVELPAAAETADPQSSEAEAAVAAEPVAEPTAVEPAVADVAEETSAETDAAVVRLATGQELGGRIVSVKSENVSLEWSSDSD
ncbi:MAG: hypothetical protein AAGE43_20395 [Pseudomonadota bacterium]